MKSTTQNAFSFEDATSDFFPETFTFKSSHPEAIPLRDQIRQARKFGVSMECLPLPAAYDEDEYLIDPNADIRVSRFDRADILASKTAKQQQNIVTQQVAAGQSLMDPPANASAVTTSNAPAETTGEA